VAQTFKVFATEAFEFLRELKQNNDREWFTPRKQTYEELLRLPMIELVRTIHAGMIKFAPQYVGEPAKCVFRIYRDTRFSKDKTPYKTHVAASFFRGGATASGAKSSAAGYYVGISPEGIDVGGGMYAPEPDVLLAVRHKIAEDLDGFRKTSEPAKIRKLAGEIQGESTSRPPKGFDPEHPAIEHLKRKQHHFMVRLEPEIALTPKFANEIVKRFEAMTPLVLYLDSAVDANAKRRL
jgi:uncharacterized protein (TIGR02453 family)